MKTVAITQRIDTNPERQEVRDALDVRLSRWVCAAGFIPVPVPSALAPEKMIEKWIASVNPHAFILSGGNDIGKAIDRDNIESTILQHASVNCMPVLGICRGMQMMCVHDGGVLDAVKGHVGTRHRLSGEFEGKIVNSYHNYQIKSAPLSYDITSVSEDGSIESIRHRQLPWEGWMWHPEREDDYLHGDDLKRFSILVGHGA